MVCQFSFKNFRSYKNETTFDFQAETLPEMKDSLITVEKASDLLPTSVVYGPNGGGKSNLIRAFACLINTVVKPVLELDKTRNHVIIQMGASCIPFMLDEESKNISSDFQVFFRTKESEYQYTLSILRDEIVFESLLWKKIGAKKPGTVFVREKNDITLGASINKESVNKQVNPKMPYLSFLAINYDFPVIAEVISWFESCIVLNSANPISDARILVIKEEFQKNRLIRFLNDLDIDISDYRFSNDLNHLYTVRKIDNQEYVWPIEYESDGTAKLFGLLSMIIVALDEGRFIVIDELDSKLHPKLLRYIIKLFHNPLVNKNGAQLLFSSHDLTTMKNDVFRRDEIWFACENDKHESEIYSLYDIRDENGKHINSTAAFDKQYLEGRYGADPYLQNILEGDWDESAAN